MAGNEDCLPRIRAEQLTMAIAWRHLFDSSSPPSFGIPPSEVLEVATGRERELMKPPTSGKELLHSRWARRREWRSFDCDSSKPMYFRIRYRNSKGKTGRVQPHILSSDNVRTTGKGGAME
jgi:hypothetical protein